MIWINNPREIPRILFNMSLWKLLLILCIVLLVFGSGRLRQLGADVAGVIRNFRSALSDNSKDGKDRKDGE